MFYHCEVALPNGFNLPQGITTVGNYFCYGMFAYCTGLSSLSNEFNIPVNITTVGNYFCCCMFYGCDYLPDSLNLPQEITTVGNVFCSSMFFSFYGTNLPDGFNLPPNINKIGKNFCAFMFEESKIKSLPSGFDFPQNITTFDYCDQGTFARNMFYNCVNSTSDVSPQYLNFPQNDYSKTCFYGNTNFCDVIPGVLSDGQVSVGSNIPISRSC